MVTTLFRVKIDNYIWVKDKKLRNRSMAVHAKCDSRSTHSNYPGNCLAVNSFYLYQCGAQA